MPHISGMIKPYIDQTIAIAKDKTFIEDPLLGPEFSRLHSTLSSIVSRDGHVLQRAIYEALKSSPFHSVWHEVSLNVTRKADRLAQSANMEKCFRTDLPYDDMVSRTIKLDLVVVQHRTNTVTAYELKRGKGYMGASTRKEAARDAICSRMLIRDFASTLGFHAQHGDAKVIVYHGNSSLPPNITLTGADLDSHFGAPVTATVDEANRYFQTQLDDMLPSMIADNLPQA